MLPAWASQYVGIPYAERGRDRSGCDCWGLVRLILMEQAGVVLPGFWAMSAQDGHAIAALIAARPPDWSEVPAGQERRFDAVLMRGVYPTENGRHLAADAHVGLVLAPGWLIHSEIAADVTVRAYRDDRQIRHRVRGFWRHAGVRHG